MPWYKLPHADLVMWFDQKMPDLEQMPDLKTDNEHVQPKPTPEEEAEAT